MEFLSTIFGVSVLAISWCFARRFIRQMRYESGYRQRGADEKGRGRQPQRQVR